MPYLTSTTTLDLEELPRSLLVMGAGYIGAELAQMFARAGVKVTLVCRSRLLPEAEPEIGAALTGVFRGRVYHRRLRHRLPRHPQDRGRRSTDRHARRPRCCDRRRSGADRDRPHPQHRRPCPRRPWDRRLARRHRRRRPNAHHPGGIYAASDVTGRERVRLHGRLRRRLAARNVLNGDGLCYDNSAMPAIVFTDPQMASVGLTEAAARAERNAVPVLTIGPTRCPARLPLAIPEGSSSSSPTLEPVAYSARISWRRRVPTASRPRRWRSGRASPSTNWRTRFFRTSPPSKG
ncbi:Mercuric ion reductase (plasmid) [Sinorhizobium fredii CCBAU 83666]|nr:Mercuric ion reductase [Sinorhizobium fredii CCBAU 83666]